MFAKYEKLVSFYNSFYLKKKDDCLMISIVIRGRQSYSQPAWKTEKKKKFNRPALSRLENYCKQND